MGLRAATAINGMFILINGAFGVAKSTVALELRSLLPRWVIFDPEWLASSFTVCEAVRSLTSSTSLPGAASRCSAPGASPQFDPPSSSPWPSRIVRTSTTCARLPALSGEDLVSAIPAIKKTAQIQVEQISNISSSDITPEIWVRLSGRVNELLANPGISGIVVTHGTNTLEETAYFLDLTMISTT